MKRIIRGLFEERSKKEEGNTIEFFDEDILSKMLRLMYQYSFNVDLPFKGRVNTAKNFLDRLSYQLPEGTLNGVGILQDLKQYLSKSQLNEFLSVIELFMITLHEECSIYYSYDYSNLERFIEELNNLLAIKLIPFRVEIKDSKIFFDRINSPNEEGNKKLVYEIISHNDFKEVNIHFTDSLIYFAKRNYPESIEGAYLALEKFLKIKLGNQKLDAPKAFAEIRKKYDLERGIFKIFHEKIEKKIDFVYSIRSKIKSHSDEGLFDRLDFLEETARFQLNEVMNLIILLNSFKLK